MLTRDISRSEQVSDTKTNPEINETLKRLPKKLEKEQVDSKCELIKRRLYTHYIECSIGKMLHGP